MAAMADKILTQRELTIDLSIPAMRRIVGALDQYRPSPVDSLRCEIDNFRNALLNLIERDVDCASRRTLTDEELCS